MGHGILLERGLYGYFAQMVLSAIYVGPNNAAERYPAPAFATWRTVFVTDGRLAKAPDTE